VKPSRDEGFAHGETPLVKSARSFQPPRGSASVHLDALRAMAAFSVLIYHWRTLLFVDLSAVPNPGIMTRFAYFVTGLGHQWVMVFFVLSGYLVGGSVLRAVQEGQWSWGKYLVSRMTRLYIVLLPALILGGALDWIGIHSSGAGAIYAGHSGIGSLDFDIRSNLSLPVFLANAGFLQDIALPGGYKIPVFASNIPLWSLSYEFWYYVAFPMIVLTLASTKSWRVRAMCGLALPVWAWFVGLRIAVCSVQWLTGVAVWYLPRFPELGPWRRRLAVSAAAGTFVASLLMAEASATLTTDFLVAECAAVLMWVMIGCRPRLPFVWYETLSRRMARGSYTLYLVHLPLLIFLKAWFQLPRFAPTWRSLLPTLGLMAIVLLYAQGVYWLFERNTDRLRRWLSLRFSGRPHAMAHAEH
jgi:peptidoglycan/LPS O-acetylase OafA/YrhL